MNVGIGGQQPNIFHKLSEWLKLVELSMAMVLGSVEDEQCFSTLSFTKNKLNNQLTTHLDLVMCMYTQKFCSLENFPFVVAIKA
jgi:hypothetical protein